MSQGKILPNCVGRLDPIVEAIRDGDRNRAIELALAEQDRLLAKYEAQAAEMDKISTAIDDVTAFAKAIDPDPNETSDDSTWERARRECGWNGLRFTPHDETKSKVFEIPLIPVGDAPEGFMESSPAVDSIASAIVRDAVEKTDKAITRPSTKTYLTIFGRDGSELWKTPMDNLKSAFDVADRLANEGYNVTVDQAITGPCVFDPAQTHKRLWPPHDTTSPSRVEST